MSDVVVPVKTYVAVFVALLFLTGLTTGVAFIDLGSELNTIVALTIAVIKALLVILFFMHVKYSTGLTKMVIVGGFFFLALLIAFTLADELTRTWSPQVHGWSVLLPVLHSWF
jgi:cytochrome c oxidase subunit IV